MRGDGDARTWNPDQEKEASWLNGVVLVLEHVASRLAGDLPRVGRLRMGKDQPFSPTGFLVYVSAPILTTVRNFVPPQPPPWPVIQVSQLLAYAVV